MNVYKHINSARVFIRFEDSIHALAKDAILGPFLDVAFTPGGGLWATIPDDKPDRTTLVATLDVMNGFGFVFKTAKPWKVETYRSMTVYSEVP